MIDSWDDLRFLLAVQRAGSLARAAAALGVDKTTVGRRLAALEAALGVRLTERVSRGYALTAESRPAIEAAEKVDALLTALEATLGGQSGPVRVTAPMWICRQLLIPALGALRATHPDVEVRLLTTNTVLDLAKREADIALRNVRPTQQSLVVRRAGLLGSAVYASAGYVARRGLPALTEVATRHFVAYEDALAYVPGFSALTDAAPPIAFRATDTLALLDATLAGLGLAILPCFLADATVGLVRVPAVPVAQEEIVVVTHDDLRAMPRVRVVCDWLVQLFAEHGPALAGSL